MWCPGQGSITVALGQLRLRVRRDEVLPLARDDASAGPGSQGGGHTPKRPTSLSELQVGGAKPSRADRKILELVIDIVGG